MDEEIVLLQKKTAKVDRLMKKGGGFDSSKTQFYEVKREKYIGELGEMAHLDSHYLYNTTNPDIRKLQSKISTLDKQMAAINPGSSSKAHNFPKKQGRHSQYIQQLNDRDKYIKQLGELVYKDDHYKNKKKREKEHSESSSVTDLGGSMASLGFNASSSSLLGTSLASLGVSFNASFSSIKEGGGDDDSSDNDEQQFFVELPPESTILIQRDESVYDVIDKLVDGGKPENSHIVNILFASQQHALDDIVMSALEKIMLRTIKEQNRKWQILRFEQCYEIPLKDNRNQQHTIHIHQEKIKDKITRLIHTLHRNLRDTKQFNKFNDLDRHEDESTGSKTKNQYGESVFYVTSNCTLVFKKNVP